MKLNPINHFSLTSPSSVYDEEALTSLELAARTAAKVNETIEIVNQHVDEVNGQFEAVDAEVEWFEKYINNRMKQTEETVREAVAGAIPDSVEAWLATHPETKFEQFVTPQMCGAGGSGDITYALEAAISSADKTGGRAVLIPSGMYTISRNITVPDWVRLVGAGVFLDGGSASSPAYLVVGSHCHISGLDMVDVGVSVYGSDTVVERCRASGCRSAAFVTECRPDTHIENVVWRDCRVDVTDSHGFVIHSNQYASGTNSRAGATVSNVEFVNCVANRCGLDDSDGWSVGFGVTCVGVPVRGVTFRNCRAIDPSESCFHFENEVVRSGVTFINCHAEGAGRKTDATYGAGYFIHPDHRFVNCTASGCRVVVYMANDNATLLPSPSHFGDLDITVTETGENMRDLFCNEGSATLLFDSNRARAYLDSLITNPTTRAFYNPMYFFRRDTARGYTFDDDGRLVSSDTYDSTESHTATYPLFPCSAHVLTVAVKAYPNVSQAYPTSTRAYITFFDRNGKTLSAKDHSFVVNDADFQTVFNVNAPEDAVYAAVGFSLAYNAGETGVVYNAPVIKRVIVNNGA